MTEEELLQIQRQNDAAFREIYLSLRDTYTPEGIKAWIHSLNKTLKCTPWSVVVAHQGLGPEVQRIIDHARYIGGGAW